MCFVLHFTFADYSIINGEWLLWKGNQYSFRRRPMSMEEARRLCQQMHSDLVTINSEAESVFLWKQVSNISNSIKLLFV